MAAHEKAVNEHKKITLATVVLVVARRAQPEDRRFESCSRYKNQSEALSRKI